MIIMIVSLQLTEILKQLLFVDLFVFVFRWFCCFLLLGVFFGGGCSNISINRIVYGKSYSSVCVSVVVVCSCFCCWLLLLLLLLLSLSLLMCV